MTTATASVTVAPAATAPPDSIGAVEQLLREVTSGGLDVGVPLFVAYFIRLPAHLAGVALAAAVRDGWDATSYADAGGYVVRLSHERLLTVAGVQLDRRYVTSFATTYDGCCDALAVEDLHAPPFWERFATRCGVASEVVGGQENIDTDLRLGRLDAQRKGPGAPHLPGRPGDLSVVGE